MPTRRLLSSEIQLIEKIQRLARARTRRRGLVLSIGDDAAAFRVRPGFLTLISSDALVEGVHFDLSYFSAEDLGWKALAVNLSDIAAMGGTPLYITTSIALPKTTPARFVEGFYRGLTKLAGFHQVALVGGDSCSSRHGLFLNVTIIGEVEPEKMLTRSGAKPGDLLFVTGELGSSALGLELLVGPRRSRTAASALVKRHLRPEPRCLAGRALAGSRLVSAMIDVSDGLSTDLHHLCRQSHVGARVDAHRIPLPNIPLPQVSRYSRPLLDYALSGGEDYELLFTVPSRLRKRLPRAIEGLPIHEIGQITSQAGICHLTRDGRDIELAPSGFDHFRSSRG